ncbi:MAG TPA: chromate resistance protein ChrB domain-containing protein, partial [Thermoanaerobaculia bacterium]
EALAMIERLEKDIAKDRGKPQRIVRPKGKTWVTRRGIKIDRIASAWLVRRFVDPTARFRFIDPDDGKKSEGEISFDMPGGEYTHEGDRCTFETIASRLGVKDRSVKQLAEIIHDIDMKDAKYGRAEVPGLRQVIEGLLAAHPRDEDRLERGFALFDDLHRSFKR